MVEDWLVKKVCKVTMVAIGVVMVEKGVGMQRSMLLVMFIGA